MEKDEAKKGLKKKEKTVVSSGDMDWRRKRKAARHEKRLGYFARRADTADQRARAKMAGQPES